jgi:hypothetical protein
MNKAKLVTEISVKDPDNSMLMVNVAIYKHENGGMFGIDSSYIEQIFDEDEYVIIPDLFNPNKKVKLIDETNLTKFIENVDLPQD